MLSLLLNRAAEQVNGRERGTATLFSLLACVCPAPRHLRRSAASLFPSCQLIVNVFWLLLNYKIRG